MMTGLENVKVMAFGFQPLAIGLSFFHLNPKVIYCVGFWRLSKEVSQLFFKKAQHLNKNLASLRRRILAGVPAKAGQIRKLLSL